jgi:transcriptional regulator with XRE-family HTH domain
MKFAVGENSFSMGIMSCLRKVFQEELHAHGLTQTEFAQRTRVTQSAITKFIQGSIPQDTLFRAIFQSWPEAETRRRLLRAHIADEVARLGFAPEDYDPAAAQLDAALENDLAVIERAMRTEPTLRKFIRRTAVIFEKQNKKRR